METDLIRPAEEEINFFSEGLFMASKLRRIRAELGIFDPKEEVPRELDHKHDSTSLSKEQAQLRILAALIYSSLGGKATVQETEPGLLSVSFPSGPVFTIHVKDGKAVLGGLPNAPNLHQYLGNVGEEREVGLNDIAEQAQSMIEESLQEGAPPPSVYFQSSEAVPELGEMDYQGYGGEEDLVQEPQLQPAQQPQLPEEQMPPLGPPMGLPGYPSDQWGQSAPMQPPMDQFGMAQQPAANVPMPPAGGQVPLPGGQPPMGPQQPYPPMPTSARRRISSVLDEVAEVLQAKGLRVLASRLDRVTNSFEKLVQVRIAADFQVEPLGVIGNTFLVLINGIRYGYHPVNITAEELERKFLEIMKYSKGRAVSWLKKNSTLASGSVKNIPQALRHTVQKPTSGVLAKEGKPVNPWKICNTLPEGTSDEKYERCCVPGTLITVEGGLQKSIEDVKVGDKVLTHRGHLRKVTEVFERDVNQKVLSLRVAGLPIPLLVTPNHPINILPMQQDWRSGRKTVYGDKVVFKEAGDLRKGDAVHTPTPFFGAAEGSMDEETAFILGVFAAEGFTEGTRDRKEYWWCGPNRQVLRKATGGNFGYSAVFALNKFKDVHLKEKILNYVAERWQDSKVTVFSGSSSEEVELVAINNREFANFCERHCGLNAKKKQLSVELMKAAPSIQKAFFVGYAFGDGCLHKHEGLDKLTTGSASLQLTSQLFWMLDRCGVVATMGKRKNKGGPTNRGKQGLWIYELRIASTQLQHFSGEFDLVRREKQRVGKRFARAASTFGRLTSVKEVPYCGKVYNLEVEGDNSYVASFFSVHNCVRKVKKKHPVKKS